MEIHASHLLSSPDCEEIIDTADNLIRNRTRHYSVVNQLSGKIKMLAFQFDIPVKSNEVEIVKGQTVLGMLMNDIKIL